MQNYRIFKLRSITEAVNEVCDGALDEHVWVSEQTRRCRKHKNWKLFKMILKSCA